MIPIYCKIVTSGDSNVGKTSLLKRYIKKSYNDSTPGTIGVDHIGIQGKLTSITDISAYNNS